MRSHKPASSYNTVILRATYRLCWCFATNGDISNREWWVYIITLIILTPQKKLFEVTVNNAADVNAALCDYRGYKGSLNKFLKMVKYSIKYGIKENVWLTAVLRAGKHFVSEVIRVAEIIEMANKTSKKYYIFNYRHLAAVFGMQTEMCGSQHIPACNSIIPLQKKRYLFNYICKTSRNLCYCV